MKNKFFKLPIMQLPILKLSILLLTGIFFLKLPLSVHAQDVRAVSLKNLQQTLKSGGKSAKILKEAGELAGITELAGYIEDPQNKDLILFGYTRPGEPALYLEDLVISLRNEWLKYAPLQNNTYLYSYPGCSIDPDPATMQKLNIVARKISQAATTEAKEKEMANWDTVCAEPQKVRVLGIPFDTRFAHIMVQADYDMKTLVDGSDTIDIPGFTSLTSMKEAEIRYAMQNNTPPGISPIGMNRFWFYPGKILIEEKSGIAYIYQSPVILLTEEMYNSARGEYNSSGGVQDPMAKRVSEKITALYDKIAEQRPVYRELANLFRFITLAKLIKYKNISVNLDYLLNDFPVRVYKVNKEVAGRPCVKRLDFTKEVENGSVFYQYWLQSCGGVGAEIEIDKSRFTSVSPERITALREKVLNDRPSAEAVSWDYKETDKDLLSSLQVSRDALAVNNENDEFSVVFIRNTGTAYYAYCGMNDPLYAGDDIKALAAAIDKRTSSDLKKTVYLNPVNFQEHKWKGLTNTCDLLWQKSKTQATFGYFPCKEDNPVEQNLLLSKGIRLDYENIRISKVASGVHKDKFRVECSFFTRIKGIFRQIKVVIIARTEEIARLFINSLKGIFAGSHEMEDNTLNTVHKIKRYMQKEHQLKDDDLQFFFDEPGESRMVKEGEGQKNRVEIAKK